MYLGWLVVFRLYLGWLQIIKKMLKFLNLLNFKYRLCSMKLIVRGYSKPYSNYLISTLQQHCKTVWTINLHGKQFVTLLHNHNILFISLLHPSLEVTWSPYISLQDVKNKKERVHGSPWHWARLRPSMRKSSQRRQFGPGREKLCRIWRFRCFFKDFTD